MKKTYVIPKMECEEFTPNEYVAACYSLYCEVSGEALQYTGDVWFNKDVTWNGNPVKHDGMLHGRPCAEKSSYNTSTGTFYENGKASEIDSVNVTDTKGTYGYYATWGSNDINGTGHYRHYGWAVLDDENRPNHS